MSKKYVTALEALRELIADKNQNLDVRYSLARIAVVEFGNGAVSHHEFEDLAKEDAARSPFGVLSEGACVDTTGTSLLLPGAFTGKPIAVFQDRGKGNQHDSSKEKPFVTKPMPVKKADSSTPLSAAQDAKGMEVPRAKADYRTEATGNIGTTPSEAMKDSPKRRTGKDFLAHFSLTHPKKK